MEDSEACEFVIGADFTDFDHFAETTRSWDLDFYQLERGGFEASLKQLGFTGLQFGAARFSRALEQHGAAPRGLRTFVIPAPAAPPMKWRGYEIAPTDLMVFPRDGELHSLSLGGFDIFTYSIDEDELIEIGLVSGYEWIEEFLDSGTEVLSLEPEGMGRLQLLCGGVFPLAGEKLNAGSRVHQILKLEIAATLVEVISGAVPVKRPIEVSANRARALRKAIELVNDHQNYPLSVEMICRETGVKARTLQYAFQEEFGMSPKRWLKLRSLNQVRKDLRQADSSQAKVVDVANKWGLWHMGQFAKDYRLAFGELPSETLFGR